MQTNLLNRSTEYVFGSPRYNTFRNQTTNLIPEDYGYYDSINGTYDKYFPCYSLDTNDTPTMQLVNQNGEHLEIKNGDLELFLFRAKYGGKRVGKVENPDRPYNSNLQTNMIYYQTYMYSKIHPGWCVIQTQTTKDLDNKNVYEPFLLVRLVGTNEVCNQVFAIDLDDKEVALGSVPFRPGIIIKQKEDSNVNTTRFYLWKCLQETINRPPRNPNGYTGTEWKLLDYSYNVFNADLYYIAGNQLNYFMEVNSTTRKFHPNKENDDSLICFNASYYY